MKQLLTLLLCVFFATATNAFDAKNHIQNVQLCPNNLLPNGDLEGGLDNWFGNGQLSNNSNMGTTALEVCANYQPAYQTVSGQSNSNYTLKVFAKRDPNTTGLVTLKFMNSGYEPISTEFLTIAGDSYAEISVTITSPANTAWIEVGLLKDSGTGCVFADDWCLTVGGGSGGGGTCTTNRLLNSNFSDSGMHWATQSGASISYINNADSYDGTSVRMDDLGARLYQMVSVQAGKTYNFQTYVKRTLDSKGILVIKFLDANFIPISEVFEVAENSVYTLQAMSAIAPSGAVFGEIALYKDGVLGSVFADDFCFSEQIINSGDLPDLTLENLNLTLDASPQGSIVNFNFDLKNIGIAAVTGNFSVNSYFSTDKTLSADDIQIGSSSIGSIAAGQTMLQRMGFFYVPPSLVDGSYYILLKADANGEIVESDEMNNVLSSASFFIVGGSSAAACGFEKITASDYPDFNNFSPTTIETGSGYGHTIGSWNGSSTFNFTTFLQSISGDFASTPTEVTKTFTGQNQVAIGLDGNYIIYSASATTSEANVRLETPSGTIVFDKNIALVVPPSTHNIPIQVVALPSGGYYMVGVFQQGSLGEAVPFVVKLDAAGTLLWQNNLPTEGGEFNFLLSHGTFGQSGAAYLYLTNNSTRSVQIVKIDATGNQVWKVNGAGDLASTRLDGLVESADGSALFFGFHAIPDGTVRKINATDGTMMWQTDIGDIGLGTATAFPSVNMSKGLIATPDGGVVGGYNRTFLGGGTGDPNYVVYRLTSGGTEQWSLHLNPDYFPDAQMETTDGGFYFIGRKYAGGTVSLKVTSNGLLTPACIDPSRSYVDEKSQEVEVQAPRVLAYPNPASSDFKLDLSNFNGKSVDLTMMDAVGRIVLQKRNLNNAVETVELNSLENGLYLVQLRVEKLAPVVLRIIVDKGMW